MIPFVCVGVLPSVVKRMVALPVDDVIATDCAVAYTPPAGLNEGVATGPKSALGPTSAAINASWVTVALENSSAPTSRSDRDWPSISVDTEYVPTAVLI